MAGDYVHSVWTKVVQTTSWTHVEWCGWRKDGHYGGTCITFVLLNLIFKARVNIPGLSELGGALVTVEFCYHHRSR